MILSAMSITRRTFLCKAGMAAAGAGFLPVFSPAFLSYGNALPRSTPEAQGISSDAVLAFLQEIEGSGHEFHGLVLLRNGFNIAQGWWSPYRPDMNHSLYSMSKSFTATAIGFAVSEGYLAVSDKVISFFPDDLPETVSENLEAMTVRDLLTMSAGHAKDTTWDMVQTDDWVKAFLSYPVEKKPGSEFLYNSGATFMLSAILQKKTGKAILEWLTPRLFKPLGIEGATWDVSPKGINTGGWGLRLKTEDLAKFGQLYLQNGKWDGFRILPEGWAEEATSFKIANGRPEDRETSDWAQGYCYQFWRSRHNSYRGDGAFGQYTLVLPEQNAVIAIHSETADMQGILDLVWEKLLPAMQDQPLAANRRSELALQMKLKTLSLQPPQRQITSPVAEQVSGKTYGVDENENGVEWLRFDLSKSTCDFTMKSHLGEFTISAGLNEWRKDETRMPGTPPDLFPIPYDRLGVSKVMASAGWDNENTLVFYIQFYETAHHDTITCRFNGETVGITFLNSVSAMVPGLVREKRVPLTGRHEK